MKNRTLTDQQQLEIGERRVAFLEKLIVAFLVGALLLTVITLIGNLQCAECPELQTSAQVNSKLPTK